MSTATVTFQSRANLMVNGRFIAYGEIADLLPVGEVPEIVAAGLLVAQSADGTFPDPQPAPRRCCGG